MLDELEKPIDAPLITCEAGETVHCFLPCEKCRAVWNERCKLAPQGIRSDNYDRMETTPS